MVNPTQYKKNEFSQSQLKRWENYRKGINANQNVRKLELETMFNLINPQIGEQILEIGTGSGYLTIPILKAIREQGYLISADVNKDGLESVKKKINSANFKTHLFSSDIFTNPKLVNLRKRKFDKITTLATFHHFDDKSKDSGNKGRISFLNELYSLLPKGGKLIIGDVVDKTNTQRYFDTIDNPYYFSPNGHPHAFFTISEFEKILLDIGFKNVNAKIKEVPWLFKNKNQAETFYHLIHNAECSPKESFEIALKILGEVKIPNINYAVNWQLGFITGEK